MSPAALIGLFAVLFAIAGLAFFRVWSRKQRTEHEARAYLAGVTYVLSDHPDRAIAELSRAVELNRQALETYFALGALFRRQGELDRAIRLHRNILLRSGQEPEVRTRALLALSLDYRKSGLQDLALETLEKLLAEAPEDREALLRYRQVLEETGRWGEAIEVQARLCRLSGTGQEVLGHLLAEVSRQRVTNDPAEAELLAARGVSLAPGCANAQLALGEVALSAGKREVAREALTRALELEPELAPKVVPMLEASFPEAGQVERLLRAHVAGTGGGPGPQDGERPPQRAAPYELALAVHLKRTGRVNQALELLRALAERFPSFWEARKELGSLLLAEDRAQELRSEYEELLRTLGQPVMGFACRACDQKLPELVFRCPSCSGWGTVAREGIDPASQVA